MEVFREVPGDRSSEGRSRPRHGLSVQWCYFLESCLEGAWKIRVSSTRETEMAPMKEDPGEPCPRSKEGRNFSKEASLNTVKCPEE